MIDLTRRQFLKSAAGAAGAGVALSLLPPALRRALARPIKPGSLRDVRHVVVLMQENRSFDHYFGALDGVRGFNDPNAMRLPNGRSVFEQPDPLSPSGFLRPFHLNTKRTSAQAVPENDHDWIPQHAAWNQGRMDGWVTAQLATAGAVNGPYTMGFYTREDIPFHYALADAFTICDQYHCSVLGPTWPNRLYLWSASINSRGGLGGPMTDNLVATPYGWTTYPERLTRAGVSWHVYQEESDYLLNLLELFASYQNSAPGSPLYDHGLAIGVADQFEYDCAHDRLPAVSWIVPTPQQCEHPAYMPAAGADFIAKKLEAIAQNVPLWEHTVVIVVYDENDGKFDHVLPPTPPRGTPDEFVGGEPIGAGFRVPCILVSPWTRGGHVCSELFDHTSVLRLLEDVTGVRAENISAWRRRTFASLSLAMRLTASAQGFPPLPATKVGLAEAEREVATLPAPAAPAAGQSPALLEPKPVLAHVGAVTKLGGALRGAGQPPAPQARSRRDIEARGRHPAGTPDGMIFPGIVDAVMGRRVERHGDSVYLYVCTEVGNEVMVVDTYTGNLVSGFVAGTNPYRIVATPDGRKLYLTNSGETTVSVVDADSSTVIGSVGVGLYPHGIAVSPDGLSVYVANTGSDTGPGSSATISVINTGTDKNIATMEAGLAPRALAVSPDGRSLYFTCYHGLGAIDLSSRSIRSRLHLEVPVRDVAVSGDGKELYVTSPRDDSILVIDADRFREPVKIKVDKSPWDIAVHPDGEVMYVTCADADLVSAIDIATHKTIRTVAAQHVPTGITATHEQVWISNNTSSTVQCVDVRTLRIAHTVELGLSVEPGGLAVA